MTKAQHESMPEDDIDSAGRYAVRVLGQSAWTYCRTLAAARREQELANRTCQPGHVIVDMVTDMIVDAGGE